ncbi:TIGR04283 family arsenosugar biosynthesis glycosyltransferase [Emticicia agri]|uniref:Glycosyltransferase n=1 Tax=Emticicia agri TaxID=2492393 RepID=A0A4Q5LUG9_9BACT|nr:TIGR04283 family arsenosugar biosynthesis glycosyltransferase [Emticicia agri]RYU93336.1 glycosyltransferase [Emticicia agri]
MISIIIPTYNEAENIVGLIQFLKDNSNGLVNEIIVSDGGSTDETLHLAQNTGAKAILSPQTGRANQMNFGASQSTGSLLYFIHADTFPPASFANDLLHCMNNNFNCGRYRTKFDNSNLLLKFNEFFTRFDWFVCYGGDQTFFITKTLFEKIGGFKPDMRIMEDYEIVMRARKAGYYTIIPKAAIISARKYKNNSWIRVQLANYRIIQMFHNGASQIEMATTYKKLLNP